MLRRRVHNCCYNLSHCGPSNSGSFCQKVFEAIFEAIWPAGDTQRHRLPQIAQKPPNIDGDIWRFLGDLKRRWMAPAGHPVGRGPIHMYHTYVPYVNPILDSGYVCTSDSRVVGMYATGCCSLFRSLSRNALAFACTCTSDHLRPYLCVIFILSTEAFFGRYFAPATKYRHLKYRLQFF